MSNTTYSATDAKRLKEVIEEGLKITQEIEDLKGGLRDTVKHVAEEIGIKPSVVNKAIRVAHKASLESEKETVSEVEELLALTGRA